MLIQFFRFFSRLFQRGLLRIGILSGMRGSVGPGRRDGEIHEMARNVGEEVILSR